MSSSSDNEFEVERILASRVTKKGIKQFLIRWKGYGVEDDTWEPEANLSTAKDLVNAFTESDKSNRGQDEVRSSLVVETNPVIKPIGMGLISETKSLIGESSRHTIVSSSITSSSSSGTNVMYRASGNQLLKTSQGTVPTYTSRKRNQTLASSLFLGEFVRQTWLLFALFVTFWVLAVYLTTHKAQSSNQI